MESHMADRLVITRTMIPVVHCCNDYYSTRYFRRH